MLKFNFGGVNSQLERDNYGCPCFTKFILPFSVDGTGWTAEFSDTWRGVNLYHGDKLVKRIYQNNRVLPNTVRYAVEQSFRTDSDLQKVVHTEKDNQWKYMKDTLYDKLLQTGDE